MTTTDSDTTSALAHLRSGKVCGCELCERAAIYEVEAGMLREQAEWRAAGEARGLRERLREERRRANSHG